MAIQQIKIDKDTTLNLDSSVGWLMKYREQFGRDILPDLLPLVSAGFNMAVNMMEEIEEKFTLESLTKAIDREAIGDLMLDIASLESVTIINITWALNANYCKKQGEEIKPPDVWVDEFESFPLDIIMPVMLKMISKSLISTKNLKRLQNLIPKQSA